MSDEAVERSPNLVADDLFRREGARIIAALTAQLGTHRLQLVEDVHRASSLERKPSSMTAKGVRLVKRQAEQLARVAKASQPPPRVERHNKRPRAEPPPSLPLRQRARPEAGRRRRGNARLSR